jgi:CheY-like chemotaxis protein
VSSTPANILLVDDNSLNLTVLETTLESSEFRLVRAVSAHEALLALFDGDFAVIVLDVQMPEMDRIQLAQLIKQHPKT